MTDSRPLRGSAAPVPGKCGAKLRKTNPPRYCIMSPMKNGRCRLHGGKQPAPGPSHPNWKHGRQSKFMEHLPQKLRASFLASIDDPDLLSVRNELALMDSRLHELLQRLQSGETVERMRMLSETVHQIRSALLVKDPNLKELRDLADKARMLVDTSFGEDSVWNKIEGAISSRISLTETERKVMEMKQANIASDRLQVLMQQLLSSVRQHVVGLPGGPEAVNGVATDLFNILGLGRPRAGEIEGRPN